MLWWSEQCYNILQLSHLVTSKFCPSNSYSHIIPSSPSSQNHGSVENGKMGCLQYYFPFISGTNFPRNHDGCFLKWCYPQIIHFNRVFLYKPSILGYHYFRKPPDCWEKTGVNWPKIFLPQNLQRRNFLEAMMVFSHDWPLAPPGSRTPSRWGNPEGVSSTRPKNVGDLSSTWMFQREVRIDGSQMGYLIAVYPIYKQVITQCHPPQK